MQYIGLTGGGNNVYLATRRHILLPSRKLRKGMDKAKISTL